MSNPNRVSAGGDGRNDNAEWAILKELARASDLGLSWSELERSEPEREKYRLRGEKLLRVISRMPDKLPSDEKTARLDRIHRIADNIGLGKDLEGALEKRRASFSGDVGRETFGDDESLTRDELERVGRLRERVLDLTEVEPGALAEYFPSGNYLFHGSTIQRVEKIFRTGGLKNGVALAEDDPEISAFDLNSGFEGISWSMNEIDALPGTRGHLAGFLAAPEDVLSRQEELVIPSRPAPYEVLQVSEGMSPKEAYFLKNQAETWGDGSPSVGDMNNVRSNLMFMSMHKPDSLILRSSVYDYQGSLDAEDLRKYFRINENRKVVWDDDLYQKDDVPPALPYIQAIIDRGMFRQVPEYKDLSTVEEVLERTREDERLLLILMATARDESAPVKKAYDETFEKAQVIRVKPEEMYFVTSHGDLEDWLKVMARTGVEPKGILLYDDEQVVMENFASEYDGNHGELSDEIGRAVGVRRDFWVSEMGVDPGAIPRSGHAGQVLLESAVQRDKVIRLVDGELKVITL